MRKVFLLSISMLLTLSVSCNKEDKDMLAQLKSQNAELERSEKELSEASPVEPSDFIISIDKDYYWVDAASSVSAHYSINRPVSLEASAEHGWSVAVQPLSETEGDITITAPDPASPGVITLKAVDLKGNIAESMIQVFVRKPYNQVSSPRIEALAYNGLSEQLATPENYRKMAEAGITMVTVEGEEEIYGPGWRNHCRLAAEAGIKVVLFLGYTPERYAADPEHFKGLDILINETLDYPAICAYQIIDEPSTSEVPRLIIEKNRIEELAPGRPIYINLHPSSVSQAGMGATTYDQYVEFFASNCQLDFITFDQYPVFKRGVEDCWYYSLDVVSSTAKRHGIPFWAFVLSCEELSRERPSLENIRLQGNMNLTYGAQCNQFFVWMATTGTNYAPIVRDGTYMPVYDECKEYNREMHNREFIFAGSDVHLVRHTGNNYYLHGSYLAQNDLPDAIKDISTGNSAAVSFIGNSGNEYVVICNKSWQEKLPVEVEFTREVYTIDREGEFTSQQPGNTSFIIDEGDMLVIKWK